jgi:ribosomal protein S10
MDPRTKCVLSDMQSLKIQTIQDLETKSKKREHFKMMTEARILQLTESGAFIDSLFS